VAEGLGGLDIVVNLAAIELENRAEAVTEDEWAHVLGVHLSGAFWLSQAAARKMIEWGQGGRINHFFHPQCRRRQPAWRNRTREKAADAEKVGARAADSPADAAQDAEVVIASLADDNAVTRTLWG
jgi:hypothetical protein